MSDVSHYFANSVTGARDRFLAACDFAGLRVTAYPGRGTGTEADDRPVFADVARAGSPEAEVVITLCCSAGGPAGFCAAGLLTAILRERLYAALPREVALVMVHAVNPKGPLWPAPEPAGAEAEEETPPWEDGMLSAAEARFQAHQENGRFDRNSMAAVPLASMIPAAWDAAVLDRISEAFAGSPRRHILLDIRLGEVDQPTLKMLADQTSIARDWHGCVVPARESAQAWQEGVCGGFGRQLAGELVPVVLELDNYQPDRAGREMQDLAFLDRSLPSRQWQNRVWEDVSEILQRMFARASDAPSRNLSHPAD